MPFKRPTNSTAFVFFGMNPNYPQTIHEKTIPFINKRIVRTRPCVRPSAEQRATVRNVAGDAEASGGAENAHVESGSRGDPC